MSKPGVATLFISLAATQSVNAGIDQTIEEALRFGQKNPQYYGQIKFDLNYRYEYADTDDTEPEPAHANTFRLRLGYLTPEILGVQAFAEYENLLAAQNDYRGGGVYGDPNHHVVADPADRHELNRLWITYKGIPDTVIKGGRQRIKIDDDRFIGNVGWRQMEQTYDAVLVTNDSIQDLTINAGYIGRIKNIFSLTDNIDAPIVNINYRMGNLGNAIGYGYWLDYRDDPANAPKSSQTYGVRFIGSPKLTQDISLHYTAEYSYQQDYGSNKADFSRDRYHIMGGISVAGITVKGAMEQLDGRDGGVFSTPLGTNHAFQGWADRFLNAALYPNGVRDVNATAATSIAGAKLMFVYHNFKDDTSNFSYGNEYDFLITKKFGKHYALLAKYAYYDGDDDAPGGFKNDTQKLWLQANVSF
nr:alginate export family protein [Methylomarinum sp. Ch1-1]MDP4522445.1 alginate export family protein [Methylomarinum sp. Ch1-1]